MCGRLLVVITIHDDLQLSEKHTLLWISLSNYFGLDFFFCR